MLAETPWPRIAGIAELPWRGTPALTRQAKKVAGERWFAVGDAAGYVEPFTGEGMAWAIASAAALAPTAIRAIDHWEMPLVREWERVYHRLLHKRQRVCRIVARVLRSPTLTALVVRALALARLSRILWLRR